MGERSIQLLYLRNNFIQHLIYHLQHKFNKHVRIPIHMALGNRVVIRLLKSFNLTLQRNIRKNVSPFI